MEMGESAAFRLTKSAQEPECGFEAPHICSDCGLKIDVVCKPIAHCLQAATASHPAWSPAQPSAAHASDDRAVPTPRTHMWPGRPVRQLASGPYRCHRSDLGQIRMHANAAAPPRCLLG